MIVGNLPVEVAVFLRETFTHEPYVDASHGTARAGAISKQRQLSELFSRNVVHSRVGRPLEITDRQHLCLIQDSHVDRRTNVMVLHHVLAGHLRVGLLEDLGVVL